MYDARSPKGTAMKISWLLNALGLFLTTTGALVTVLYMRATRGFADEFRTLEAAAKFKKHQQLLIIVVALLATWLVIQDLGVIFL